MSYKIAFCGTPVFAVPALAALQASTDFEVVKVFTQPDRPSGRGKKLKPSPVKTAALDFGLSVETPEKISTHDTIQWIKEQKLDLAVVVAYGQILSQDFLDAFNHGCVNIHSSLLPRWRGAAPMQRALMEGDPVSGVSLQQIVKKLDAGDVIAEKSLDIPIDMGASVLYSTLSQLGAGLLTDQLVSYLKGDIQAVAQDESKITHAKKIEKAEAKVDWNLSALEVHNKIRGLDMGGPFAMAQFQNKSIKLHKSLPNEGAHHAEPGMVVDVAKSSFTVACGQGELEIFVIQPESKARMTSDDFIRGYHLKEGDRFD